MFGVNHWELLLIAGVVLLLFGTRLPSVMRSLGLGVVEFKQGLQGIEDDVKKPANQVEDQSNTSRPHDDQTGG